MSWQLAFNGLAIGLAICAAYFWYQSANSDLHTKDPEKKSGTIIEGGKEITVAGYMVISSLRKQSTESGKAALFAAAASIFQAFGLIASHFRL